ncbi:hypothetical protein [Bartonella sp. CB60]|uniref:hypothetical protein n=1 Tax=Bartonella sp. CB60 TaxID=3113619 RepID=UPI00300E6897
MAGEGAKLIVKRRADLPPIFLRDIHQRNWSNLKGHEDVKCALELLCHSNIIREASSTPVTINGRPSTRYEWNPLLRDNGDEG